MATYTYTPEKGDPISRLRWLIGDRTAVSTRAQWSDEDLLIALRDTAATDFLAIHCAVTSATQASIEILTGASYYQVQLKHTVAAVQTTTNFLIGSPKDVSVDKMVDLIDGINAVTGWVAALAFKAEGDPAADAESPSAGMSETARSLALGRKAWSLAPTDGALNVLTSTLEKRLSIYDIEAAAARCRQTNRANGHEIASYGEGKVSITFRDNGDVAGKNAVGVPRGFYGRVF